MPSLGDRIRATGPGACRNLLQGHRSFGILRRMPVEALNRSRNCRDASNAALLGRRLETRNYMDITLAQINSSAVSCWNPNSIAGRRLAALLTRYYKHSFKSVSCLARLKLARSPSAGRSRLQDSVSRSIYLPEWISDLGCSREMRDYKWPYCW